MRVLLAVVAVSGCHALGPIDHDDIRYYTSIDLCPNAQIRDLTTHEERDGFIGFSFQVELALNPSCARSFVAQLSSLSPAECAAPLSSNGCWVQDTFPKTGKHTTIVVKPFGEGRFYMHFYM